MKKQSKLVSLFLLLVVVTAVAGFPRPVRAAAPTITDIFPTVIVNDISNSITIKGTDFADNATVSFGSQSMTVTSFSSTQLIIRVPAGFDSGLYSITVTNPGTPDESTTLSEALQVLVPTPTPLPPTPSPFRRPVIVIDEYKFNVDHVEYGQDFTLLVSLDNAGGSTAYQIQVTFVSTDLIMLNNGGVLSAGDLGVVGKAKFTQSMTAISNLEGVNSVSIEMDLNYSDEKGTTYTDKFNFSMPVGRSQPSNGGMIFPTATPTLLRRSQLVVVNYETDVQPLQTGSLFTLSLGVQNVGTLAAKSITMIIGGGSASGSGGTPSAGVSGGSGEFTNFAPVGSSNVQSLGDLAPDSTLTAQQSLIVNVSTNPGAYPMKITFSYLDPMGNPVNDDQVITLLVYSLPVVEVNFYQPVPPLMAGMPATLPLQVVNLGKKNYVLGNMTVTAASGTLENAKGLVGSLDPGGYYTLDSTITPDTPGMLELTITIDYTDDFNQPRSITKSLTVEVMEAIIEPTPEPSTPGDGTITPATPETSWQKVWRFILGLLGLDSAGTSAQATPEIIQSAPIYISPGDK